LARRRLLVGLAALEALAVAVEPHLAFDDLADELGRDVAALLEQALRHGEAVEDVLARVADHLVDAPDLLALAGEDLPARLDHEPGDRVGAHTDRPPTYQTGPCVATGYVSAS